MRRPSVCCAWKPDDEDGVALILHAFSQVVQDAAGFAHAAGGDDDARTGLRGDGFRLFLVRNIVKAVELEGRIAADQAGVGLLVVALGVHLEDVGQLHGERRIHVHRNRRHLLGGAQPLERIDHLLRAFEREGGNEDLAAAANGAIDGLGQRAVDFLDGRVSAVPVGAFA